MKKGLMIYLAGISFGLLAIFLLLGAIMTILLFMTIEDIIISELITGILLVLTLGVLAIFSLGMMNKLVKKGEDKLNEN